MKKICIAIPCYNEEKNIKLIFNEINKVVKNIKNIKFNYLFIDDASEDSTWEEIRKLSKVYKSIKAHRFTNNRGKEIALFSSIYENNNYDALIFIDADLQHPPYIIKKLIKEWQNGFKIVSGRRIKDKFSLIRNLGSSFFYFLLNKFSEIKMKSYSTDFRLIDKDVINYLKDFKENISFMRGMIDLTGFEIKYVDFSSDKRDFGSSKFSFRYLFSLATSSFINFSLFPLRIVGYLGIIISISSFIFLTYFLISIYLLDNDFNIVVFLFLISYIFIGLIFASLGLIALYIGNIHREVLRRPRYLIEDRL